MAIDACPIQAWTVTGSTPRANQRHAAVCRRSWIRRPKASAVPLQKNVLNRRRWSSHQEPRIAIITRIERTYHRRRRETRLGRLTYRVRDNDEQPRTSAA